MSKSKKRTSGPKSKKRAAAKPAAQRKAAHESRPFANQGQIHSYVKQELAALIRSHEKRVAHSLIEHMLHDGHRLAMTAPNYALSSIEQIAHEVER